MKSKFQRLFSFDFSKTTESQLVKINQVIISAKSTIACSILSFPFCMT